MKRFDDAIAFHGHSCPGLALGYRVALLALRELGERAEDEELVAIVENSSCAVDAVQVLTGCTFGKGNLIFRDHGKHVYTFIKRPSGESIRISVDWKKPAESPEEKKIWEKYMKGDRSKKVLNFVHDKKAQKIQHILAVKDTELMTAKKRKSELPPVAEIFRSLVCDKCGEQMMKSRSMTRDDKTLCIPCFEGKH